MNDLVVTSAAIDDSSTRLVAIKKEFDDAGRRVTEHTEVWGQRDVRSAMAEFVNNWTIHRGKISTAVGDLQKKIHDTGEGWNQAEQSIAEGLTTTTE